MLGDVISLKNKKLKNLENVLKEQILDRLTRPKVEKWNLRLTD